MTDSNVVEVAGSRGGREGGIGRDRDRDANLTIRPRCKDLRNSAARG